MVPHGCIRVMCTTHTVRARAHTYTHSKTLEMEIFSFFLIRKACMWLRERCSRNRHDSKSIVRVNRVRERAKYACIRQQVTITISEEKRITHDPRLNVNKKSRCQCVHCNENKTLSISGKRAFRWFFIFLRFVVRTSCVFFVAVYHSRSSRNNRMWGIFRSANASKMKLIIVSTLYRELEVIKR